MPSSIPGYEYDIFISYRQKDNAYDGWVTGFIANLRKELEATFKEDIFIYDDENKFDGLQKTHQVEESLSSKLKCLIFIPIISQTYCDPNSYAWKSEFLVFRKFASEDTLGLKVKLQNGNVASRIVPVRIHDLEPRDNALLEKEIGGQLNDATAVEFVGADAGKVSMDAAIGQHVTVVRLNDSFGVALANGGSVGIRSVEKNLNGRLATTV